MLLRVMDVASLYIVPSGQNRYVTFLDSPKATGIDREKEILISNSYDQNLPKQRSACEAEITNLADSFNTAKPGQKAKALIVTGEPADLADLTQLVCRPDHQWDHRILATHNLIRSKLGIPPIDLNQSTDGIESFDPFDL
jgi:hypothetical protein